MENEVRKRPFLEELKRGINNDSIRSLEVYRENGKLYIAKFDYEVYTGQKARAYEEFIMVTPELVSEICERWDLEPEYYFLKTRERESSVDFYRKKIEDVFNNPYKEKVVQKNNGFER